MPQRKLLIIDGSAENRAKVIKQVSGDPSLAYRQIDEKDVANKLRDLAATDPAGAVILAESTESEQGSSPVSRKDHGDSRQDDNQRSELEKLYAEARANNDALRAADAAKDDFLAMLSHQLRTPLAPVLSLVSSALDDPGLNPDTREAFSMIRRNVEVAGRLIDDLLDHSQITSGRLKIEKSPVDVHSCIEAALDVCHAGFDDKKIAVRTELSAAHSVVIGEFARLNQALWNVFKNAAKFCGLYGNVTIATSNAPGRVIISVRDDGMGIEKDRLSNLFGPAGAIKPQPTPTGVGLGLAITRAIVEGHGGEIHADSDGKGRGTTFRISLPTIAAVLPSADEPSRAASAAARGKSILVVEDHQDTLRVLSRVLRRKGFAVTTAGSVADASKQFTAAPADLVICDIGLPDGTGWDLMEKLRPLGPVRAIAVSGYGMGLDVKKSSEVGFVAHLTKPIDFPKLESLIIDALAPAPK